MTFIRTAFYHKLFHNLLYGPISTIVSGVQ